MPNILPATLPVIHLARHAETVYNAGRRMQGWMRHTPLTKRGIAQATAMGEALRAHLGVRPDIDLWCSTAGRTQQTAALICEALETDFFRVRQDERLQEIHVGGWEGHAYADIVAQQGEIMDTARRLFTVRPPGGEWYPDIAARLASWLEDVRSAGRPCLVISHGMTSRVLRGMLAGGEPFEGQPIAVDVPQGSIVTLSGGTEALLHRGAGAAHDQRLQGV